MGFSDSLAFPTAGKPTTAAQGGEAGSEASGSQPQTPSQDHKPFESSGVGMYQYQHGTNIIHGASKGPATYQHETNTAHVSSTGTATYQHETNIIPGSHQHQPADSSRMRVRDQSSSAWGTGGASGIEGQYGQYESNFAGPTETEPSPYVWGGGDDELIGNPDDGASTFNGGLPAGLNSMGVGDLYDFDQPHHSTYL